MKRAKRWSWRHGSHGAAVVVYEREPEGRLGPLLAQARRPRGRERVGEAAGGQAERWHGGPRHGPPHLGRAVRPLHATPYAEEERERAGGRCPARAAVDALVRRRGQPVGPLAR